ncbi:oligosaccharide flippase family protein [uncultured Marinobacter sp.]|uniref:oligosaccharide flippase family protein n=1 Tax=uncultured Marinobacter sp. TaxID=187379 RepID=UPI002619E69D|nr:oligosaccharide flippase family protein [uncultured Marinobacter sp.]
MTSTVQKGDASRAAVRHLGGQTIVVMGGTLFTFIVGLPFQIYLARQLGTEGLGVVGIAEALVQTAAGFLAFGLAPLAMRYIPEYRVAGASRAIRQLVGGGLLVLVTMGVLGASLLTPVASLAPDVIGLSKDVQSTLSVLALLLPITMVSFFLAQSLRGFQEIRVVVLSTSILTLSAKVVITVGLFLTFGVSTLAYAWAIVFSQVIAILPLGWAVWRLLRALPSEEVPKAINFRAWGSFAGTNYASGILSSVIGNLDRIIIGALLGPASVGVLMVVRQLQQFPTVFHQIVLTVVSPVFARLKAAEDQAGLAHQLHLANDWIFRLAAGLILMLAVLAEYVLGLYGPEFASEGSGLMIVMTLAVAVNLGTGPVGIMLNMTGHHVALLRISIVTAFATFIGYFILIPLFGLVGAGLAVLASNIANKSLAIWLVKKRLGIDWYDSRFRAWILPLLAAVIVLLAMRPVMDRLEGVMMEGVVLAVIGALTYVVYFGVNFIAGLHDDDYELLQSLRTRIPWLKQKESS